MKVPVPDAINICLQIKPIFRLHNHAKFRLGPIMDWIILFLKLPLAKFHNFAEAD